MTRTPPQNLRVTATEPATFVVSASEASWDDLQTVFGTSGPAARCQCQRFKLRRKEFYAGFPAEERGARVRQQTYPIITTNVIMEELLVGTVVPGVPLLVSSRHHRRPVVLVSLPTSRHSAFPHR